jgi:hypothetical protein
MNKQPMPQDSDKKSRPSKETCPDDFKTKPDLNGKNDSGPDPEVHGKEIPPQ